MRLWRRPRKGELEAKGSNFAGVSGLSLSDVGLFKELGGRGLEEVREGSKKDPITLQSV